MLTLQGIQTAARVVYREMVGTTMCSGSVDTRVFAQVLAGQKATSPK